MWAISCKRWATFSNSHILFPTLYEKGGERERKNQGEKEQKSSSSVPKHIQQTKSHK